MIRVLVIAAGSALAAVLIDFFTVWIWLSFIHDGPEFPY